MKSLQSEFCDASAERGSNCLRSTGILSGVQPGGDNVGEILLRDMIECLGDEPIGGVALVPRGERVLKEGRGASASWLVLPRRFEYAYRPLPGRGGAALAWACRMAVYEPYLATLVRRCADWAQRRGVRRWWAVLDTPTVIEIAARVAGRMQVPLCSLVWDAPEYLAELRGLDAASKRRLMARFGHALRRSDRVAVVSEAMKTEYETAYGTPCLLVRHGLGADLRQHPAAQYTSSGEFSIGVAGGLYCESGWQALLQTLDGMQWRVAGKAIRLVVLGGELRVRGRVPMHVQFLGWRSVAQTIETLSQLDITYLPQPFERRLYDLARLSFPTKLSTYAAAGRPVLVHCPAYASLASFAERYPLGAVCSSLEPDQIAAAMSRLAGDAEAYRRAAEVLRGLAATEFSREHYERQVKAFLA